ncbi:DUF6263 family protein [Niabella drilacis]|uniref:DUF4412 domain-containing protein n=1 Tax=Niabella drilacis (strain DSM 25811 / CCM 8410 / CCUG 62505 / LMG 26954 / E90) TaxID=1285928 RepID=A0A1G6I093_NIADE|nr:DUF6263 family protein [Niabella drilacis]SDB99803.1 hypothetical protein SAMN04487894_10143 [Niabella drilacis]
MKKTILALFCMAASAASMLHAQTVTLKFNPANGSRYDVINNNTISIQQTLMGQPVNMKFGSTVNMHYDIADAGADKDLTLTYGPSKMNIDFMGQELVMDSESPDTTNAANSMFRSIRGKKIKILIAADGTVKKTEGFEDLAGSINTSDSEAKKMAEELFSEATIKSLLEQSFKMYPKDPVSPGSTWTANIRIEKPYTLTLQNNYTLKKIENGKSLVTVAGKIGTDGLTKMMQQGMEMEINLDGTVAGTITMDNATGVTEVLNLVQQLKGIVKVQGMEVPMEATVDTKIGMQQR